MRKASYWLAAMVGLTLILSACSSEEDINPDNRNLKHITFTAGQSQTRTIIDGTDATQINWEAGETISILDGTSITRSFTLSSGAGKPEGTFEGMAKEESSYTAVYPYQEKGLKLNGNSVEGAWLDSVQNATAGTFDPKANLMMARTKGEDKILQFHNMTAFVKVTPQMDCEQITIVSADSTVGLAGTMTMTLNEDGTVETKVTDNASHQVSLTGDIKAGQTYYIAIAPAALKGGIRKDGIRMGITTADGKHYYKDASKLEAFTANKVLNLGSISVGEKNWLPYVTFSAEEAQEVMLDDSRHYIINSMDYSTDYGKHWSHFSTDQLYAFGKTTRLMLRGNNPNGTAKSNAGVYSKFEFGEKQTKVACSGDIRTLVKKEDYKNAATQDVYFTRLFEGCTQLTSAPELQATELAAYCYAWMFHGCTSLTQAPLLPAKELKAHCYEYMFMGCEALTSVTMLATSGFDATECLYWWLAGAGTNGSTVTIASGMSSEPKLTSEISNYDWLYKEQQ